MPSINYSDNMGCAHSLKLVGKNSMICSLFNFCPQFAPSRRHGVALVGLAHPNKAPSPTKLKHVKL